jgi:5-methylthioadenosine/S-adenosylhomocysteine deaminase
VRFDTIIHNGILVTADSRGRVIDNGWVGIRAGVIHAVEPSTADRQPPEAARTVDADGGIVMPGLVNTHTHLPMSLFRGLADDLPLMEWLNDHIFPVEARFVRPETVHWGTLLSCAEMLLSGTTCCCGGYFHEAAVARAVEQSGMRAVLAQGVIDLPAPGVPDAADNVRHAQRYARRWLGRSECITPSIFCHAPYTCSDATLIGAKQAADELGLVFQVHVAETGVEWDRSVREKGRSPVAHLDRLGVLDPNTLMAHCVWIDDADMALMAERGCQAAHCPESNMKLAAGVAPVAKMRAAGINVGLGTDGCASNNDLDLFGEMGAAAKLHKVVDGDPTTLPAASVLQMATVDGARAVGLGDRIGSLETGKQADIAVLDVWKPHLTPMYHPISHLVYAAGGADVRHVFVAGRQVVRDRRLVTMDIDHVMDRVDAISEEIKNRFKC